MKIYSHTQPIDAHMLDAFCALQAGFTDQFVYYRKTEPRRYMGLGRCIAVPSLLDVEYEQQGPSDIAPIFFSFTRFDAENPQPTDELFHVFPALRFMLPEVVLIETDQGVFLQVNSLGPVYQERADRFAAHAQEAKPPARRSIAYTLESDSRPAWTEAVQRALDIIEEGRIRKVVLARRQHLVAEEAFTSQDVLVNLIEGPSTGTVFMYRYGDVFFCGCTPELLIRKHGETIEGMCLAGTTRIGATPEETTQLADELAHDDKNLREHAFVVDFMRQAVERTCCDVDIPDQPRVIQLTHVQHLYTPVRASIMEGRSIEDVAFQLHPTPALAGAPVGEALRAIRAIEGFNRGFFGGPVGVVDARGDGEFSVAIRSGVFDGATGWVYAGCGIVAGSDAASEYDEIDLKLQTILSAFDGGCE